ncbi:MAG: hypothetical protein IPL23_08070 [Saprospiraceae bacterium]|nr:hypothetical protein [Saprospiraceae bacterium]
MFISDKLEANTQGLMPQGYAAGFISSTASAQVYAHELAHGVFNFDHSWLMYDLGFHEDPKLNGLFGRHGIVVSAVEADGESGVS